MSKTLLGALGILLISTVAVAHGWYPPECCSDADCRVVPCDLILEQADKTWKYLDMIWRSDQVRLSLDSACHACYSATKATYCLFIQAGA